MTGTCRTVYGNYGGRNHHKHNRHKLHNLPVLKRAQIVCLRLRRRVWLGGGVELHNS